MTELLFHITTYTAWSAGQKSGEYRADSLGQVGFIHFSKAAQVLRVANDYYAGQQGLLILLVDPSKLKAELRWDPSSDQADELFPHIYGPVNLEAVVDVFDFEPGPDGKFSLPAGMK
jgi:uncharacterized protein (DUF952 family)